VVSAIAHQLGRRVTLSVPTLVPEGAGPVVARLVAKHGVVGGAAESELLAGDGEPGARLLLAGRAAC
jgi:hypothetical protein